jgi:hypothetical protein
MIPNRPPLLLRSIGRAVRRFQPLLTAGTAPQSFHNQPQIRWGLAKMRDNENQPAVDFLRP